MTMNGSGEIHTEEAPPVRIAMMRLADNQVEIRDDQRAIRKDVGWLKREKQGVHLPTIALLGAILLVLGYIAHAAHETLSRMP